MIVDGSTLIATQLAATSPEELRFDDGSSTPIAPAHYVPETDDKANHLTLDGAWQVCRWPFTKAEAELAAADQADDDWEQVPQPGKVFYADPLAESQPIENWDRVALSHIDDDDGAVMRRTVTIPNTWQGKRVLLRFDSIYPAGRIYLNGKLLGEHLSGLTPFERDVTDQVEPGEPAVVAVRLLRKHRFVKMDMVRHALEFGGLAQSACFHAVDACHLADYHLVSALNESLQQGSIAGSIDVCNMSSSPKAGQVTVSVADANQTCVATVSYPVEIDTADSQRVTVSLSVNEPALWNDEFPNLYTVAITLSAGTQAAQTVSYRSGFRRFELAETGPTLNGRPVKFRGVNHLTFHPDHGMHTPRAWLRQNLEMMKKANVNTIRTHFLGPRDLAELCDEMGIYLLQELPIDWGTNYIHDPEWVGPAMMRLEGSVRRDRHHPSIMVWSVGNENMPESAAVADDGWNHLRIYDRFVKQLDPSRPTMFPPPGPANKIRGIFEVRVGDVADIHYSFEIIKSMRETGIIVNPRSWDADMEEISREDAIANGWSGVWFSSEYGIFNMNPDLMNSPYLSIITDVEEDPVSGRNTQQVFIDRLRREWGDMRGDPTCLGGAYFPWICAGAGDGGGANPWGWVRWAEDADWGVITADLTPKSFYWAMRVIFSPIWLPNRFDWAPGMDALTFDIHNQFNAIDLKDCTFRTQMAGGGKWMGQMRQFRDIELHCPAGETRTVSIPLWNEQSRQALAAGNPVACRCTLLDPSGFRVLGHDIMVVPKETSDAEEAMPIGPDAVLK